MESRDKFLMVKSVVGVLLQSSNAKMASINIIKLLLKKQAVKKYQKHRKSGMCGIESGTAGFSGANSTAALCRPSQVICFLKLFYLKMFLKILFTQALKATFFI